MRLTAVLLPGLLIEFENVPCDFRHPEDFVRFHSIHPREDGLRYTVVLPCPWQQQPLRINNRQGVHKRSVSLIGGLGHGSHTCIGIHNKKDGR